MFKLKYTMSLFIICFLGCGSDDVTPKEDTAGWCGETSCEPEQTNAGSTSQEDAGPKQSETQREPTPCQMLGEAECKQDPSMGCGLVTPKRVAWNSDKQSCETLGEATRYCVEAAGNAIPVIYYTIDDRGEVEAIKLSYPSPPPLGDWLSCQENTDQEKPDVCRCS